LTSIRLVVTLCLIEQLTLGVDVDKGKAAACERKPSGQAETLRQHKQESSEREQLVAAEWHKHRTVAAHKIIAR
jgi:hypothetical protein